MMLKGDIMTSKPAIQNGGVVPKYSMSKICLYIPKNYASSFVILEGLVVEIQLFLF
jgi:hypothetical protein